MNNSYPPPVKRRRKLKYKNIAIILAILLLIIVFVCASCSPRGENDDNDKLGNDPTSDNQQDPINFPELGDDPDNAANNNFDPTSQLSYTFDAVDKSEANLGEGTLVLVNNNIKFRGSVDEDDLIIVRDAKVKNYWVSDRTVKVLPKTMDALNSMLSDFYIATGNDNVMVKSGHRSVERQQQLYEDELTKTGASTSTLVAMPGFSEHHTGFVVDFTTYNGKSYSDFDGTGDYAWIMENCHKYGFINRYPAGKEKLTLIDNEPWHFRYVGIPHATAMKQYGYCLEEYIAFIKSYTIDTGFLLINTHDGAQYIIYYTPLSSSETTAVYIPLDPASNADPNERTPYPYEISGNNIDGFIVTVQLKAPTANSSVIPDPTAPENQDNPDDGSSAEDGNAGNQ